MQGLLVESQSAVHDAQQMEEDLTSMGLGRVISRSTRPNSLLKLLRCDPRNEPPADFGLCSAQLTFTYDHSGGGHDDFPRVYPTPRL